MAPPPSSRPYPHREPAVAALASSAAPAGKVSTAPNHKRPFANEHIPNGKDTTGAKTRSYVVQRHERDALVTQVRELEAQLDALRRRAGLPTQTDNAMIDAGQAHSWNVTEQIHVGDAYLGRMDSMLTRELLMPPINTLTSFIHLPKSMEQCRAILRGMQERKLRRGIEVAAASLYHLDPTVSYVDEKGIQNESGEYYYYRSETDQFSNFTTARQLYDMFLEFRTSMEISVTDGLGQLTLREDADDSVDPTIWNHRFVTLAEEIGVPEELNFVGFAQFYNHSPYTNSPMGILVVDTVNVDDLYPYVPEERTCKDVQSVHMVYEVPKPGTTTGETVVVFKQYHFGVQLPPLFAVAPGIMAQLHRNFPKWPNFITKHLHEYVVPENAAAPP